MPRQVTARQGDTLDLVCWRELGTTAGGVVEQALALNRALADLIGDFGCTLPEGTPVILPDPPSPAAIALETVNLWD